VSGVAVCDGRAVGDFTEAARAQTATQTYGMTTQKDLPEEATEEPHIESPEEEGARGLRRVEATAALEGTADELSFADPHNPLRMPGELSSRPRDQPGSARRRKR
jgi:hypothetical protein